jgi:flagellar basal-body rod protein FlgC
MKIENFFSGMNISAAGMSAQRRRMNAIASNMANVETTRTAEGGPYKRKVITVTANDPTNFNTRLQSAQSRLVTTDDRHIVVSEAVGESVSNPASGTIQTSEHEATDAFRMIYSPEHPDADAEGYVKYPNINIVTEMVDMISASRTYEANVTAINAAKQMAKDSLEI